jgi:hypothetical protein
VRREYAASASNSSSAIDRHKIKILILGGLQYPTSDAGVPADRRIEQLQLLSKMEQAGLLSKLEQAGFTLSKIEQMGLLSTAEKSGEKPRAAAAPAWPGAVAWTLAPALPNPSPPQPQPASALPSPSPDPAPAN